MRKISVTRFTYYRWRKEYGGLKTNQVKRLKKLEKEKDRDRKAVSDTIHSTWQTMGERLL
jgi:hypothetical protein